MERKISLLQNNYYHVYNRGVDKRKIFNSNSDYHRFLALLYVSNSDEKIHISNQKNNIALADVLSLEKGKNIVAIGAYCLMPNHFHLLLTPLVEGGISKFMLKLQTGYSMYFNIKNEREGSLFQGTYKATHAQDDEYLKYLYAYIHLNPAKLKDKEWKIKGAHDLSRLKNLKSVILKNSLSISRKMRIS